MKITQNKITESLQNAFSYSAILIYGNNYDKVISRLNKVTTKAKEKLLTCKRVDFQDCNQDVSIFENEVRSFSMFDNKKVFILYNIKVEIFKNIIEIIENNKYHLIIIIENELKANSPIRNYFEKAATSLSIACYKDGSSNLKAEIIDLLQKNNATYTIEALDLLVKIFKNDTSVMTSEIGKLTNYSDGNISKESVLQCIDNLQPILPDDLAAAIIHKDFTQMIICIDELYSQRVGIIQIIRITLKYFYNLLTAKIMLSQGITKDIVVKKTNPPIFFKHIPIFYENLQLSSVYSLTNLIDIMIKLEISYKKNPELELSYAKYILSYLSNNKGKK